MDGDGHIDMGAQRREQHDFFFIILRTHLEVAGECLAAVLEHEHDAARRPPAHHLIDQVRRPGGQRRALCVVCVLLFRVGVVRAFVGGRGVV